MSKIAPFIWFNNNSMEAVEFYTSLFDNSKIECTTKYLDDSFMPKDSLQTVKFYLCGEEFNAINGGPIFKINPSISFFVDNFDENETVKIWNKLSENGAVLMELASYPFGEKFGWCIDQFGVSWQVSLTHKKQKITPVIMYQSENGFAKEAINLYTSLFEKSGIEEILFYGENEEGKAGTVKTSKFKLCSRDFVAMDSSVKHNFDLNEAISFYIYCSTQEEIDKIWDTLKSFGGSESIGGWVKDRYGVWWQIVNEDFFMMMNGDRDKALKVMNEVLTMKKIDIERIRKVYYS